MIKKISKLANSAGERDEAAGCFVIIDKVWEDKAYLNIIPNLYTSTQKNKVKEYRRKCLAAWHSNTIQSKVCLQTRKKAKHMTLKVNYCIHSKLCSISLFIIAWHPIEISIGYILRNCSRYYSK